MEHTTQKPSLMVALLAICILTVSMATLNIFTWNVRGIMSSATCVGRMLDMMDADVAVVCEHKLTVSNMAFIDTLHSEYTAFPQNQETDNAFDNKVSLLVKKSLLFSVSYLPECESDRTVGIKFSTPTTTPVFIFGVYLPHSNNIEDYKNYIRSIWDIWSTYNELGDILMLGDFNARTDNHLVSYASKMKKQMFTNFVSENNISILNKGDKHRGTDYSFFPMQTTLDYMLVNHSCNNLIGYCETISSSDIEIASDHLLLFCTLSLPINHFFNKPDFMLPAWHKASAEMLITYQLNVDISLSQIVDTKLDTISDIETQVNAVTDILRTCATGCIPQSKFKQHAKPYWSTQVKLAHRLAMDKRKIWLQNNKPRGMQHVSYSEYKKAKSAFRKTQEQAIFEYENSIYREIDESSECDIRLFWKLINQQKRRKSNACYKLSYDSKTASEPQAIANLFSEYFKKLYTFDDNHAFDKRTHKRNFSLSSHFTINDIVNQLKTLKKRKSPGIDCVQNEHIIYGGRKLHDCLSKLFTSIMTLQYIPQAWKTGIIVPLYKGGSKSKSDPDSYRAISLLPVMYKLFEKVVHENLVQGLKQNISSFPNIQQQGYQKQLGPITASFNLHEAIFHSMECNATTFVACLDIKKAFDTVWHKGMLHKLNQLGTPSNYISTIQNAYTDIRSIVSVNGSQSAPFEIQRGVRQGGVMSALLYLVFINDLLEELQNGNLGVPVCDIQAGNPTLVDDISLIAASPLKLQLMINTVVDYAETWKFSINVNKSSILIMSKSSQKRNSRDFIWTARSEILKVTDSTIHVGIPLSSSMKCNVKVEKACQKGRNAFHSIAGFDMHGKTPRLNPITLAKLYRSKVIPCALYGCETWSNMTQKDMYEIQKLQHYCMKKIQCLPAQTRSLMCESMLGFTKLTFEIDKRKLYFLHRLINLPDSSATKQIFLRRMFTCVQASNNTVKLGFIPDIINILTKYGIMRHLYTYINNHIFPSYNTWKRMVNAVLYDHASQLFRNSIAIDTDFERFRHIHANIQVSPLWKVPTSFKELRLVHFVVKCLALPPQNDIQTCDACNRQFSDLIRHIVTSCPKTLATRTAFWDFLVDTLSPHCSVFLCDLDNEALLHILMGEQCNTVLDEFDEQSEYCLFLKACASFICTSVNIYYNTVPTSSATYES